MISGNSNRENHRSGFDQYAERYGSLLNERLWISGEKDVYFDLYKLHCLQRWVIPENFASAILDFGCGTGKLTHRIARTYPKATIFGYDISIKSIRTARERWRDLKNCTFDCHLPESENFDVILCANVFHHIERDRRIDILGQLRSRLKDNGTVVIFEQNPYNPVTRYVVKTCIFDKDAVLISAGQFAKLATRVRLKISKKRYIVFFPRILKIMRFLEAFLGFLPIGAQYVMLLKKTQ